MLTSSTCHLRILLCQLLSVVQLHYAYLPFVTLWLGDKFRFGTAPRAHCFPSGKTLVTAARHGWTTVGQAFALSKHAKLPVGVLLFPGKAYGYPVLFLHQERAHVDPLRLLLSAGSFRGSTVPWVLNSPFFHSSLRFSSS